MEWMCLVAMCVSCSFDCKISFVLKAKSAVCIFDGMKSGLVFGVYNRTDDCDTNFATSTYTLKLSHLQKSTCCIVSIGKFSTQVNANRKTVEFL